MKYCSQCNTIDYDNSSTYCLKCGHILSDKPRDYDSKINHRLNTSSSDKNVRKKNLYEVIAMWVVYFFIFSLLATYISLGLSLYLMIPVFIMLVGLSWKMLTYTLSPEEASDNSLWKRWTWDHEFEDSNAFGNWDEEK